MCGYNTQPHYGDNMSLITRKPIDDVQARLDELEYVNSQCEEKVMEIPDFVTDTKGKYFFKEGEQTFKVEEGSINQLLGIGKFAIRSFKDAQRVMIKNPLDASCYMLNSVKTHSDKPTYKFGFYKESNTHTVNPKHPQIDGLSFFRAVFNRLGMLGLTADVYNLEFDPITGRQSLDLIIPEWNHTSNPRLNQKVGTGFKITNSTTGHGHFSIQNYAVQLICTNGMIASVRQGGVRFLHRTEYDLLKKSRGWMQKVLKKYVKVYEFNDKYYEQMAEATIETAKQHSNLISDALERAREFEIKVEPRQYFEAINKKTFITQQDMERMILIRSTDPTMDRNEETNQIENNLLNIVQSITRYANEVENSEKRDKLQEYAFELATTPLIVNN